MQWVTQWILSVHSRHSRSNSAFFFCTCLTVTEWRWRWWWWWGGVQINHLKVFTNAQTQAGWHVATLLKCFSMWMWCQHLFHTYLHVEGRGEETCSPWPLATVEPGQKSEGGVRFGWSVSVLPLRRLFTLFIPNTRGCSHFKDPWQEQDSLLPESLSSLASLASSARCTFQPAQAKRQLWKRWP